MAAVIRQLTLGYGAGTKLGFFSGSITGTGTVVFAPAGSNEAVLFAWATAQSSATTIPSTFASISSISASYTVNIVCIAAAAAANSISGVATTVAVLAYIA